MFCRENTDQVTRWNFAELKLRTCEIQWSARLNRKQMKANESSNLYLPKHRIESRRIVGT